MQKKRRSMPWAVTATALVLTPQRQAAMLQLPLTSYDPLIMLSFGPRMVAASSTEATTTKVTPLTDCNGVEWQLLRRFLSVPTTG
ncbi:unnamed protein product [Jaminaea pallidilutea]